MSPLDRRTLLRRGGQLGALTSTAALLPGWTGSAAAACAPLTATAPGVGPVFGAEPGAFRALLLDKAAAPPTSAAGQRVRVAVPAGDHVVTVSWTPAACGAAALAQPAPPKVTRTVARPRRRQTKAVRRTRDKMVVQPSGALAATGLDPEFAVGAALALAAAAISRARGGRPGPTPPV